MTASPLQAGSTGQGRYLSMPEAAHQMVVDHAGGLHVGVDDGATDKFEPALLEVFADGVG
jgi:hypothetical protein